MRTRTLALTFETARLSAHDSGDYTHDTVLLNRMRPVVDSAGSLLLLPSVAALREVGRGEPTAATRYTRTGRSAHPAGEPRPSSRVKRPGTAWSERKA